MTQSKTDQLCIDTIRFLAVDMVQKANSGHPGLPLGAAPIAYTIWDRFLRFNPRDPQWPNRDRFVLSAGHGSAMLYALLHVTGYDLPMEELRQFRQWGSQTAGHPEYGLAPGVEATTGPLGQGLANAVGMAITEAALAARYNRPGYDLVNHYTYVLASDGDLMEGISSEAGSLAGHLGLGKLIVCYDNNHISIEGNTSLAFTEDRIARFEAFGWHVQSVDDGNDVEALTAAIRTARGESERPSFIAVRTHIGYGSPHKQDTADAHGSPLGEEEVRLTKQNLGWPVDPPFLVPDEAREHFGQSVSRGRDWQSAWATILKDYGREYPNLAREFDRVLRRQLPEGWDRKLPAFSPDDGPLATRVALGKTLNAVATELPELMGGSADLAPSTHTLMTDRTDYSSGDRTGRNMHFGVREHVMGGILNGMALHGGVIPYGSTFLIFSDYMRPAIRLAALAELPVRYVFTHDSIGLGEDGPTHQPVEHLLSLRAIPNLKVIRPADANETREAWRLAMTAGHCPVALVLTRQKLPILDPDQFSGLVDGVSRGGYILWGAAAGEDPDVVLVATGSEVHPTLAAAQALAADGLRVRMISMPCWEIFREQADGYRQGLFPVGVPVLAVEAGVSLGWRSYLDTPGIRVVGVDRFGASAPGKEVMAHYGLTKDNILAEARHLLNGESR